ncbi:nuclear envelope integral membrane protein isoform X2 [Panulirus ornatus]|uniref:nuclear envelope integral membrane protein isoform X2 n=1 Tax=Panulirus ornatus TaxID=150431 RepID=UPI003A87DDC8
MAVITNITKRVQALHLSLCFLILICLKSVITENEMPNIAGIQKGRLNQSPPKPKAAEEQDYFLMSAGRELIIRGDGTNKLHVFCHKGEHKTLATLFKTIELRLEIEGDSFHHYEGPNSTFVRQEHQESSWLSFYPWRLRTFKLDLFKQSCVGIEASTRFTVGLRIRWVDFWRVVTLVSAMILFFAARCLAKNAFFHYTTGITIGILGSLLILVYILARLVPKKSGAVTLMIGGWGLIVYLIQYLWQNFLSVLKENHAIAVGYVVVAGLISFAMVYRYGPLTDTRSINLVQWAMQLVALLAVFLSSQYREATLGLVIIMVTYHNIPDKWKSKFQTYWRRRFPPKVKRLTEEEYLLQANVETRKALDELRAYCRSPNCDAWKTVSRLKSPQRFAEFVEGGSHLDDEAILAYESNHLTPSQYEDEDEDELYLTTDDEEEES